MSSGPLTMHGQPLHASSLRSLSPQDRATVLAGLTDAQVLALLYDWSFWARQAQLAPAVPWHVWLLQAGRGFGKTRSGAEVVRNHVERKLARRIALVAETAADGRDVMVEGPSGILATAHPKFRPRYEPSKRRLTWPNGAQATVYSAEDPEQLRGPEHDFAWADEIGKWRHDIEAWDNLVFGLRIGENPRVVATTTPRRTRLVRRLLESAEDPTSGVICTHGRTIENLDNLAPIYKTQVIDRYAGTRIGRQELDAVLLEDVEGALWTRELLDALLLPLVQGPDVLTRIAVSVDPPASSDDGAAEAGITVGGTDAQGTGYLLEDASEILNPDGWGRRAVLLYDRHEADLILGEVNNGGEMVEHVVKTSAEALYREKKRKTPVIHFKAVHASRGKRTRAEPISALCEQKRIRHVGTFPLLEDQLCTWAPQTGEESPDRLDSYVWLFTELMLGGPPAMNGQQRLRGRTLPKGIAGKGKTGGSSRY